MSKLYLHIEQRNLFKYRPFDPVVELLPGRCQVVLDVSSKSSAQLEQDFGTVPQACDTLVLVDVDTWIWHELDNWVVNHPITQRCQVFIVELGYNTVQLSKSVWRIGYPYWYFYRTLPQDTAFKPKPGNLTYNFGCLNNRPAPHRLWLGTELHSRDLLSNIIYTQNNYARMSEVPDTPPLPGTVPALDLNQPAYEAVSKLADWPEFLAQLPIQWNNQPITNEHTVHHPAELEAYCNITTEGMIEDLVWNDATQCLDSVPLPQFSEKSWRPWAADQVPVYLACAGHLPYIASLGFETMSDLLPPGYDTLPLSAKITAIVDLVAKPDYVKDYYYAHLRELKHNHELVFSNTVEQRVLKQIKDAINE